MFDGQSIAAWLYLGTQYETQKHALVTHCSLVQHFNGERFRHVMLAKSLFQLLQRGALPLPEHHQVNVTEGEKNNQSVKILDRQNTALIVNTRVIPCWKVQPCAEAAKYLDLEKQC